MVLIPGVYHRYHGGNAISNALFVFTRCSSKWG